VEKEKIGVWGRVRMAGLKNRGLIEISQDPKRGDFVIVMSKGIRKKYLLFNLPEEMWRVRCSKEEASVVIHDFLNEKIMAD
jgi:hypothetical protein